MTQSISTARLRGWALVAVQGLLFGAIAFFPSPWSPSIVPLLWPGIGLIALGSAGMIASGVQLGRSLTPHPEPNRSGLVARGLYQWARHPMYTSLLILFIGIAMARGLVASWVLVVVLIGFFHLKAHLEEQYLLRTYEGYADYASRTGRFMPGIGKLRDEK